MQADIAQDTKEFKWIHPHLELYSELQKCIEQYSAGIGSLAIKVGISKPTLWRWLNLKNRGAPNPYHVLSLARFATKKDTLVEVIEHATPSISSFLSKSFPKDLQSTSPQLNLGLNEHLEDFYCYFIYLLCGTEKPMKRSDIKHAIGTYLLNTLNNNAEEKNLTKDKIESYGEVAELKIDQLIANNLLKEENRVLVRTANVGKIKVSISKKHLPKLFTFFKEKNMSSNSNMMYAYQESIPRKTIEKIIEIQYKAFIECYQLMEASKCKDGENYILTTFFENFNFD